MTTALPRELCPEEKLFCAVRQSRDAIPLILGGEEREVVRGWLDMLNQRERYVIRLRYGFESRTEAERKKRQGSPHSNARTFEEVAGYFQITRERVSQIEARALRILRQL